MLDFVIKIFMSIEKKGINVFVVWKIIYIYIEKGYNNLIRFGVNEVKINFMLVGDI